MSIDSSSHKKFEHLVAELFKSLGHEKVVTDYTYTYYQDHDCEIDILFGTKENLSVVEVKSYRPENPPSIKQFQRALKSISDIKSHTRARNGLLVVSCELNKLLLDLVKDYSGIEVWDIKDVFNKSIKFPSLYQELSLALEVDPSRLNSGKNEKDIDNEVTIDSRSSGQHIIEALREVKPGRVMATAYEDVCIQSLKYIFERDFIGWHEQHETIDGLNRRDLVCRVLPKSEVWEFILTDLQSRYVVFEFKNYSFPITQKEIITTERYLYPTALRRVAIVISQNGCAESAKKVIEGAMREHGKLIIPLSTEDMINMINMKDNGSDPNVFMFDIVDQFLMSLGR
jgi:hypothetical protein